MTANIQYITDASGKRTAVLIPIEDWKKIQLNEAKYRQQTKAQKVFREELTESFKQVKAHTEGNVQLKSAQTFLDEL